MEDRSAAKTGGNDGFSSLLDGILSNPEMMSMISTMAGRLKESQTSDEITAVPSAESEEPVKSESSAKLPEVVNALAPLLSGEGTRQSKHDSDRACLLRALKPYLSQGRSEAIDYIIKFSSVAELLKNLS